MKGRGPAISLWLSWSMWFIGPTSTDVTFVFCAFNITAQNPDKILYMQKLDTVLNMGGAWNVPKAKRGDTFSTILNSYNYQSLVSSPDHSQFFSLKYWHPCESIGNGAYLYVSSKRKKKQRRGIF